MTKFRLLLLAAVTTCLALTAFTIDREAQQPASQQTAAHVEWISIAEAQKRCDVEPRRIFIDFTTSWCGWCKTMDRNTFSNPVIAAYMNKNYYCVSFDAETSDTVIFNGQTFTNRKPGKIKPGERGNPHDFAVAVLRGQMSYPSYGLFNKERNSVSILQGYMPPEQFEPYLHYYAEGKETSVAFADYQKTFVSELPKTTTPTTPLPTGGH